jgi:hypothetical protein
MNMFDDESSQDVARRIAGHLEAKIKKDAALSGVCLEVSESVVSLRGPFGTLDITCDGPEIFGLEDDKQTANAGVRVQQRAYSRNQRFNEKQMVDSVKRWLSAQRR